jgi:hypothetical protein
VKQYEQKDEHGAEMTMASQVLPMTDHAINVLKVALYFRSFLKEHYPFNISL